MACSYSCQPQYQHLRVNGGAIVSIASMSGRISNRGYAHAAYCAAKAGVVHLATALAIEWAADDIRVTRSVAATHAPS